MRHIKLDVGDELFSSIITPETFIFICKHIDAFKKMWYDQGKTFWVRFLLTYRSTFLNTGRAEENLRDPSFPFCYKKYLHCLDGAFVYIHKAFIEGNYGEAKNLIVHIMILTKYSFLLLNVGSNSLVSDPFYLKSTRESFRNLFGEPCDRKVPFLKVMFMCPVYVHFGGALYAVLNRWLSKEDLPDEQIKDIDKTVPYWIPPRDWTKTDFIPQYFEQYLSVYWKNKLPEMLNLKYINKKFFVGELPRFCRCKTLNSLECEDYGYCRCKIFGELCPRLCPMCDHTPDMLQEHHKRKDKRRTFKGSPSHGVAYTKKKKTRNSKQSDTEKNRSSKMDKFDDPFYRLKLLKMAEKKFKKENEATAQKTVSSSTDTETKPLSTKNKKKNKKTSSSSSSNISAESDEVEPSLLSDVPYNFSISEDFNMWDSSDESVDYSFADRVFSGWTNTIQQDSSKLPSDENDFCLRSIKEKLDLIEQGIEETGGMGFEEFLLLLQAGKELTGSQKQKDEEKGAHKGDTNDQETSVKQKKKFRTCANCLKKESSSNTFKKCSRCKADNMVPCYYCSKECQVEDWEERHRDEHQLT